MKLVRGLLVIVVAGLVLGAMAWLPTGWWSTQDEPAWHGYVEAEFVDIAADETARLAALAVQAGDSVSQGQLLFRLEAADAAAARDEAAARLAAAQAELADLQTGQRPEEIAAIEARRAAAMATLQAARENHERQSRLQERRAVPEATLEEARERFRVAEARLTEIENELALARLPARAERIEAARRNMDAAEAALERAEARLARLSLDAPVGARVEQVFFRPGEMVPAGRPVVRLLPPANLKVRTFVPQSALGSLSLGTPVAITCDGCGAPLEGEVSFIAAEAEFTPPVIYSVAARRKLVFLVEAEPLSPGSLRVGQPVDVRLAPVREARR